MTDKPDYPPISRFVTGHDLGKVAKVIMQGPATNAKYPSAGTVSTLIWSTDRTPADIAIGENVEDLGARIMAPRRPPTVRASRSSISRPATSRACTAPRPSIT